MSQFPKLICETKFVIESVVRKPHVSFDFLVTLVLKGGERRIVTVSYSQLFDFFAFRDTALGSINLFLRHEAEVGTTQGKLAWLNLIQSAIQRSTTESGQIPSSRG